MKAVLVSTCHTHVRMEAMWVLIDDGNDVMRQVRACQNDDWLDGAC